jgi:dihydroorotate dehydrogenase (fumarate)
MDLSTNYMGLKLKHPIVPSASPLSKNLDSIRRLEDAGAPAIVMYSLFEEQIIWESQVLDHYLSYGTESFNEAVTFYPDMKHYNVGPEEYLNLISKAKAATQIPIIGSLNGVSTGGWVDYARKIQEAGADALELNVYYIPTDLLRTGAEVEQMYLDVVRDVKNSVTIPVAVKLSPFFSSTANMAHRLAVQGADALVLFNRFYQPDFDLENLDVVSHLTLSTSNELRLPLRWVAILYRRVPVDFAITTGIHNSEDALKALMAGAKVAMVASELLENGMERINQIVEGVKVWMQEREYESVGQMVGSISQVNAAQPAMIERANYMRMLQSWRPDPSGVLLT